MTEPNDMMFPLIDPTSGATATGLTKREYFAAMAMQGITGLGNSNTTFEQDANAAVKFADALINALNTTNA